jgi:hypothetical protein
MRNVSDKICRRKCNTYFVINYVYENPAAHEMIWGEKMIYSDIPKMKIWRMRSACWIPKATNTHSECVMLIAFPLQQCLRKRASTLRHTYIGCLVLVTGFIHCPVGECRKLFHMQCLP